MKNDLLLIVFISSPELKAVIDFENFQTLFVIKFWNPFICVLNILSSIPALSQIITNLMVQVQCWWSKVLKPNSFEGFADVGWFHVPKVVKAQKLFSQCSGLNKCIQLRLKKMPFFIWLTAYIIIVLMDLTNIFKLSTSWRDMLHFSTIGLNLFTNNWTFVWGIYRRCTIRPLCHQLTLETYIWTMLSA